MKKAKKFRRILSLLLSVLLLAALMPAVLAEGTQDLDELMAQFDRRVQRPKAANVLAEPEEKLIASDTSDHTAVLSRAGTGIRLASIQDHTIVTVYAKQNGYVLARSEDGSMGGWIKESCLRPATDEYIYSLTVGEIMTDFPRAMRPAEKNVVEDAPLRMKVESTYGKCIYAYVSPYDETLIGTVWEGTIVFLYAIQDGYALAVTEDGVMGGWMGAEYLVPEDDEASRNGIEREKRISELMKDFGDNIQRPKKSSLLDEPEQMTVRPTFGKAVYVMDGVGTHTLGVAQSGLKVTVYARQRNFALARSEDGSVAGWIHENFLAPAA